jgi:nucleotide-binding universal stress UspA family protein
MKAFQRILIPTDFSSYADKAFDEGLMLAKQFKAEVYLLHVVDDIRQCAVDYCLTQEFVDAYRKDSMKASKEKLEASIKQNKEAAGVKVSANVRIGAPYEEILKEEREKNIDLIVMASHGKTGFIHHLMGSVAERVSRGAKGQVMLVKASQ